MCTFPVKRGAFSDAISTSWELTNKDNGKVRIMEGTSTDEPPGPLYESYQQWQNPVFKLPFQVRSKIQIQNVPLYISKNSK